MMALLKAPAISISIVMAALVVAGSVACIKLAPAVIALTGKSDPSEVVADEVAGQALTFLAVPLLMPTFTFEQLCIVVILGYLLYRAFDSVKPWPIHRLEKLPAGWGILADDLMAAVYAAVALTICIKLWIAG
jgi:phosphatidylglycerophosphatase A